MTTVKEAAIMLLSICDGAITRDKQGYTGVDSIFVRNVLSRDYFTYNQEKAIHKILLKYRKQLLNSFQVNYDDLKFEEQPFVELIKQTHISKGAEQINIPFGKYKNMTLAQVAEKDFEFVRWMANNLDFGFIRDYAKKVLLHETIVIEKPKLQLSLKNGRILIKSPFEYKDKIKELPERHWNPDLKVWEVPLSVLKFVVDKFPNASLSIEVKNELDKIVSISKLANKTSDENINIKFDDLELLPFQSVGIKFIENSGGNALIADEMGLGKTIQVLAYLRLHPEIRPAIIVCPASLKLNWQREAEKWLESKDKVSIINGKIEDNKLIYIINYDILMKHENEISKIPFKVIILDESHYVKNQKANRTKTTIKISKNIPNKILLTGTPVLNRPKELFTQLNIINSIAYPKFTTFAFRYCDPKNNGYGWNFNGISNTEELNDRLKTIMIRRTKEQVLKELPDKRYQTIVLPLSNKSEYKKAEDDLKSYLQKNVNSAEHLVRIEVLKQISVKGKMYSIIENIHNFIESGQKLVVFAHHKVVIDELMFEFKDIAVSLTGETSMENRQKAIDDFQNNPNIKLFVGNIQAAGVGITLTKASNIMFIEFPWTPSQLQQATDRLHRIGQKNAVNVIYLVGEDSIDIDIVELLEKKSKVINAIVDGKEITNLNILEDLIKKLQSQSLNTMKIYG